MGMQYSDWGDRRYIHLYKRKSQQADTAKATEHYRTLIDEPKAT